jgi:hypothetical protein
MRIILGQRQRLFGDILSQAIGKMRGISHQHLGDTRQLGGGLGGRTTVMAGHEDMDFAAALSGRGDGMGSAALQGSVIVFGNDESSHNFPDNMMDLSGEEVVAQACELNGLIACTAVRLPTQLMPDMVGIGQRSMA